MYRLEPAKREPKVGSQRHVRTSRYVRPVRRCQMKTEFQHRSFGKHRREPVLYIRIRTRRSTRAGGFYNATWHAASLAPVHRYRAMSGDLLHLSLLMSPQENWLEPRHFAWGNPARAALVE